MDLDKLHLMEDNHLMEVNLPMEDNLLMEGRHHPIQVKPHPTEVKRRMMAKEGL